MRGRHLEVGSHPHLAVKGGKKPYLAVEGGRSHPHLGVVGVQGHVEKPDCPVGGSLGQSFGSPIHDCTS
jgi:hypothetical protein